MPYTETVDDRITTGHHTVWRLKDTPKLKRVLPISNVANPSRPKKDMKIIGQNRAVGIFETNLVIQIIFPGYQTHDEVYKWA